MYIDFFWVLFQCKNEKKEPIGKNTVSTTLPMCHQGIPGEEAIQKKWMEENWIVEQIEKLGSKTNPIHDNNQKDCKELPKSPDTTSSNANSKRKIESENDDDLFIGVKKNSYKKP